MKNTFTMMTSVLILLLGTASGQDRKSNSANPSTEEHIDMQLRWIDADALSYRVNNEFVAADGNYVAQNREELQTYHDLGLKYQHIDQAEFRSQLQLPEGEGVMIKSAPPNSKGYQLGFRQGDIVLKVANQPVDDQYKFVTAVKNSRGKKTTVVLKRAGTNDRLAFSLPAVEKESTESWILGVQVNPISRTLKKHLRTEGVIILAVVDKSPAQKMGLQIDDVIVAIDSVKIKSLNDLQAELKKSKGEKVKVHLIRDGNKVSVEIVPMKQKPSANVSREIPYLKWSFAKAADDYAFYSKYDFDKNGYNDFYVVPMNSKQTQASLLQRIDELSAKIDELKKQVDQFNSTK